MLARPSSPISPNGYTEMHDAVRSARLSALAAVALALSLLFAPAAAAQDAAPAATVEEEEITRFTRAYAQIEAVREQFQDELGRTHADEALAGLREEMHERIGQILAEHELTREEYDRTHLAVMVDPEARERFQELLEELGATVEEE